MPWGGSEVLEDSKRRHVLPLILGDHNALALLAVNCMYLGEETNYLRSAYNCLSN